MKIFILGGPGSGKTTLAKKIADKYKVEFFELDKIFRLREKRGYKTNEEVDRNELVESFVNKKDWISEGVYRQNWLDKVLQKADIVFILKTHKLIRNWRVTKRTINQIVGREKSEYPANLKLIIDFYKFNERFERERYDEINERLERLKITPVIIKSSTEAYPNINKFLCDQ